MIERDVGDQNPQTSSIVYSAPLSGSGGSRPILTAWAAIRVSGPLGCRSEWLLHTRVGHASTANINSPSNADPYGPRPFVAGINLQQFQQSGRFSGDSQYMRFEQNSLKRVQLFLGYFRSSVRSNADTPSTEPQSAYSDSGEYARPSWQATHNSLGAVTVHLPEQLLLSSIFGASSGQPFNLLTGSDNNGDGVFNTAPSTP